MGFLRFFRSVLWLNAVALTFPIQGLLLRMLTCWPPGTFPDSESAPAISNSAFFGDPQGLLAAIEYPQARSGFGLSYVHTLFGGVSECYSGGHLIAVCVALTAYSLHFFMSVCTVLFTGARHHSGAELHVTDAGSIRRRPGTALFLVWDLYFYVVNINSAILLTSAVGDFMSPLLLGGLATVFVLVLGALYTFGAALRERNFEVLVFASVLALSSSTFIACVAVLLGGEENVDLTASVLTVPFAALFAGVVISRTRIAWASTVDSSGLRWTAPTLHWVNSQTRWAAQAVLHSSRSQAFAKSARKQSTATADAWNSRWEDFTGSKLWQTKLSACRAAIRPTVSKCLAVLHQLIARYPHSAMPHLAAAEYLSSPVVSTSQQARLQHLAIAWKLGQAAPWHRVQVWQHLQSIRMLHISVMVSALQSRQAQVDAEISALVDSASRVRSVRANVIQMAAAAGTADAALLSSVSTGTTRVYDMCAAVLSHLSRYKSDKVVHEKLLRTFVQLLGAESEQSQGTLPGVASPSAVFARSPMASGFTSVRRDSSLLSPTGRRPSVAAPHGKRRKSNARRQLSLAASIRSISYDSQIWNGGFVLADSTASQQLSLDSLPEQRTVGAASSPLFGRGWLRCRPNEVQLHNPGLLSGASKLPFIVRRLMDICEDMGALQHLQFGELPTTQVMESGIPGASVAGVTSNTASTVGDLAPFYLSCEPVAHLHTRVGSHAICDASASMLQLLGISAFHLQSLCLSDIMSIHTVPAHGVDLGRHRRHPSLRTSGHRGALSHDTGLNWLMEGCTVALDVRLATGSGPVDQTQPGIEAAFGHHSLAANIIAIPTWSTGSTVAQRVSQAWGSTRTALFEQPHCRWLLIVEPLYSQPAPGGETEKQRGLSPETVHPCT